MSQPIKIECKRCLSSQIASDFRTFCYEKHADEVCALCLPELKKSYANVPYTILEKSMESGQILKNELHSLQLKLKCGEGERDEYKYQLKKAEKEIKRLQMLLEDAERNCFSDSD